MCGALQRRREWVGQSPHGTHILLSPERMNTFLLSYFIQHKTKPERILFLISFNQYKGDLSCISLQSSFFCYHKTHHAWESRVPGEKHRVFCHLPHGLPEGSFVFQVQGTCHEEGAPSGVVSLSALIKCSQDLCIRPA